MKKINARVKPVGKKEVSKSKNRAFKCERCTCISYFESVEFGEDVICPECGAKMYEVIKKEQKKK